MRILCFVLFCLLSCVYIPLDYWFLNHLLTLKDAYRAKCRYILASALIINSVIYGARFIDIFKNTSSALLITLLSLAISAVTCIVIYSGRLWYRVFLFLVCKGVEMLVGVFVEYSCTRLLPEALLRVYLSGEAAYTPFGVLWATVIGLLLFLCFSLLIAVLKLIKNNNSPDWMKFAFILVPLSQLLLAVYAWSLLWKANLLKTMLLSWYYILGLLLAVFGDVLLFVLLRKMREKNELEKRVALIEAQQQQYLSELEMISTITRRQNVLNHDLKNQLLTAAALLEQGHDDKALASISSLSGMIKKTSEQSFCANPVVNAVLNNKASSAAERNIRFDTEVLIPAVTGVSDLDLCSLFSNILDNALNAAASSGARDPHISLECRVSRGFLLLSQRNSFDANAEKPDDYYSGVHGFGMGIIEYIANKYSGRLMHRPDGDEYLTEVTLTLNEVAKSPHD